MVVHPSCKYTKEELLNYEWQKDRLTGEHINKPVDKYNHCLDALRYACERFSKNTKIRFTDRSRLF